jgi:polyisoprenoid-binding protein YceI
MKVGKHILFRVIFLAGVLLWTSSLVSLNAAWSQSRTHAAKEEDRQLAFNQGRSTLSFSVSSTLHRVRGKAKKFEGRVIVPSTGDPSEGSVILDVEASSLDTDHEGRDRKMKESVLEVAWFPVIRFKSTEIRNESKSEEAGQKGKGEVIGVLDLHGVQKRIAIPVEYAYGAGALQVKGKVTIKRSDFQIPEPKFLFLRVGDEIEIEFDIQAFPLPNPS